MKIASNIMNGVSQTGWISVCQLLKYPSSRKYRNQFEQQLSQLSLDLQNDQHLKIVYSILQMPFKYRGNQIIEKLDQLFGRTQYFQKLCQKYGQRYKNKIFAHMISHVYKCGKRITKVGQQSDQFFIILKGEVIVLYCRQNKQVQQQTNLIRKDLLKDLSKKQRILSRQENHYYFKGIYIEEIEDFQTYFNTFGIPTHYVQNILTEGKVFGQLGIIYKQKRMANIVAKEDSLIATVSADKYLSLMAQNQQQSINQILRFLQQNFYSQLRNMDLEKAQRYFYLFTTIERKINSQIFTVKTQVTGFYIILQGSVVVYDGVKNQEDQLNNNKFTKHCSYLRQRPKKKLIQVKNLLHGQSFGLQQVVDCLKNDKLSGFYKYTAITRTHTRLLFCPFNKLVKLIKYDKNLIYQLQQKVQRKHKLNWFQKENLDICKTVGASNLHQKSKDQAIRQFFPKRYIMQHRNTGEIRSPTFNKKQDTDSRKKIKRPASAMIQKQFVKQGQKRLEDKGMRNDKWWKKQSCDESTLLINILNDKIKLNERMKQQTWSQQRKKKSIIKRNPFVKKSIKK